jgi:hypothetical protein
MSKTGMGSVPPREHSDSTLVLGLESELAQPARSRHLSKTRIGWAAPLPTDHFGNGHKGCCTDGNGYHRKAHLWNVWTRRGTRCCFCWRVRSWEPL